MKAAPYVLPNKKDYGGNRQSDWNIQRGIDVESRSGLYWKKDLEDTFAVARTWKKKPVNFLLHQKQVAWWTKKPYKRC